MKKTKTLQWLVISACLCTSIVMASACRNDTTIIGDSVTLDLYEKTTLQAVELTGEITWSSSDEGVVTVAGGVVTPVADGTAEVTATDGTQTKKFPVTVADTGARPAVSRIDDIIVYETQTYNLAEDLKTTYKNTTIMEGVTYSFNPVSDKITVSEEGIVTGVKEGIDQINVTATYMGYTTSRKTCNVTVLSANYVEPMQSKVSISTVEGDVDPTSFTLSAKKVVVDAKEVEDAQITAQVVSGDEFITLNGLEVTAKAIGTATIELSSTVNGKTVKGTVTVTVHDDKVSYNPNFLTDTGSDVKGKLERVTDGDETGNYRYTSPEGNYWQRALIDSSSVSQITQKGYKAFTYKLKLSSEATYAVYIPSALASANGTVKYDLTGGKVTNSMDLLEIYDEQGNSLKETGAAMETGKWYTVAYDLTTYESGWAMIGFTMGDTGNGDVSAYMKDFNWCTTANLLQNGGYDASHSGAYDNVDPNVSAEKDDFINSLTFASASAKMEKVVAGDFAGSYKWMSKSSAYGSRLTFNNVHDAEFLPQEFFTQGKHYISFEVYMQQGDSISFCNWPAAVDGDTSRHQEGVIDKNGAHDAAGNPIDSVAVFNKARIRSGLGTGDWYTVVIEVEYDTIPVWTFQWLGLTGSKYTPAIAYIRNVQFTEEMPVEEVIPGESERYNVDAGGGILEDVKEGDEEIVKYSSNSNTNSYENRVGFSEVSTVSNVNPQETFFNGSNHYITFQIRVENDTQVAFANAIGVWADYMADPSAKTPTVRIKDAEGNFINEVQVTSNIPYISLQAGEWYTVVMYVEYETMPSAPAWIDVRFYETDAVVYFKDLTFSEEDPFNGEFPAEPVTPVVVTEFVPHQGSAQLSYVTEGEFEGAILYDGTGLNWYTGSFKIANVPSDKNFVSFKIYCVNSELLLVNGQTDDLLSQKWAYAYDETGKQVTALTTGAWYTVVIAMRSDTVLNYLTFNTDQKKDPVAYLKDVAFTDTNPVTGEELEIPSDSEGLQEGVTEFRKYGGNAGFYYVTEGDFTGAIKYDGTGLNWWTGSFVIADVADNNVSSDCKFISFKIYCVNNNIVWVNGQGTSLLDQSWVTAYNESGEEVTALTTGAWYTIVISLSDAAISYLTFNTDAIANPVAYLKDLTYSQTDPMTAETDDAGEDSGD